jgi:hypothetical protein
MKIVFYSSLLYCIPVHCTSAIAVYYIAVLLKAVIVYVVAKQRADWNLALEKSLVDILHEHKDSGYRGDTGCWSSEGWNKMVKEFHVRNKYVNYTKGQIQDKEGQLKRDYRMLKAVRKESGVGWDEERQMIVASPAGWSNLEMVS